MNRLFIIVILLLWGAAGAWGSGPSPQVDPLARSQTVLGHFLDRADQFSDDSRWWAEAAWGWETDLGFGPQETGIDELRKLLEDQIDQRWQDRQAARFFLDFPVAFTSSQTPEAQTESWENRVRTALPELLDSVGGTDRGELEDLVDRLMESYRVRYFREAEAMMVRTEALSDPPSTVIGDRFGIFSGQLGSQAEIQTSEGLLALKESLVPEAWLVVEGGLEKWSLAEKDLAAQLDGWKARADESYRIGLATWGKALDQLNRTRADWEDEVDRTLADGRDRWQQTLTGLEASYRQASGSLELQASEAQKDLKSQVSALSDLYGQAVESVRRASEASRFWVQRLTGAAPSLEEPGWADLKQWAMDRIGRLEDRNRSGPGPDTQKTMESLRGLRSRVGGQALDSGDLEALLSLEDPEGRENWETNYQEAAFWLLERDRASQQGDKVWIQLSQALEALGTYDFRRIEGTEAQQRLEWADREVLVAQEVHRLLLESEGLDTCQVSPALDPGDRTLVIDRARALRLTGAGLEPSSKDLAAALETQARARGIVFALEETGTGPLDDLAVAYRQAVVGFMDQVKANEELTVRYSRQADRVRFQSEAYLGQLSRYLDVSRISQMASGNGPTWVDFLDQIEGLGLRPAPDLQVDWIVEGGLWASQMARWADRDPAGFSHSMEEWGLAFGHLMAQVYGDHQGSVPNLDTLMENVGIKPLVGEDRDLDAYLVQDPGLRAKISGDDRIWLRTAMSEAYEKVIGTPVEADLFRKAVSLRLAGGAGGSQPFAAGLAAQFAGHLHDKASQSAGQFENSGRQSAAVAAGILVAAAANAFWNPILSAILVAGSIAPAASSAASFDTARTYQAVSEGFADLARGHQRILEESLDVGGLRETEVRRTTLAADEEFLAVLGNEMKTIPSLEEAREALKEAETDLGSVIRSRESQFQSNFQEFQDLKWRFLDGDPAVDLPALSRAAGETFGPGTLPRGGGLRIWASTTLDGATGTLTSLGTLEKVRSCFFTQAASLIEVASSEEWDIRKSSLASEADLRATEIRSNAARWETQMSSAKAQGQLLWTQAFEDFEKRFQLWEDAYRREYESKARGWEGRFKDLARDRDQWIQDLTADDIPTDGSLWGAQAAQSLQTALEDNAFRWVADLKPAVPGAPGFLVKILSPSAPVRTLESLAMEPWTSMAAPGKDRPTVESFVEQQSSRDTLALVHLDMVREARTRDQATKAWVQFSSEVAEADGAFQDQFNSLFWGVGFRSEAGRYIRKAVIGTTLFQTIYENQQVDGYRSFEMPGRDCPPDSGDLESLRASVFGSDGLLDRHWGRFPKMKDAPDWSNVDQAAGFRNSFDDLGTGESGRLGGWFQYFGARSGGGWAALDQGFYNKKLWDDRGQFLEAPTLRTVVTTGVGAAASALTGGLGGSLALLASEAFFTAADVGRGADAAGAWGAFGKRALAVGLSGGMDWLAGSLGIIGGMAADGSAVVAKSLTSGGLALAHRGIAVGVESLQVGPSGLGWDQGVWSRAWDPAETSNYAEFGMAAAGTGVESLVNIDSMGFLKEKLADHRNLGSLAGALASTGASYGLTGQAVFNVGGLVEVHVGGANPGVQVGTAGPDLGPQAWWAGWKGLEVWSENQAISQQASGDLRVALRSLASAGDGPGLDLYRSIMDGTTTVGYSSGLDARAETLAGPGGSSTILLGPPAPESGPFDLAVVLAHEARRNGLWDGDEAQRAETRESVAAHMSMASEIQRTYPGTLEPALKEEAAVLEAYQAGRITPDQLAAFIDGSYGSDADYWKLMNDGRLVKDQDGWLRNQNGGYVLDQEGRRTGAPGVETGLLNILYGGTSNLAYDNYNDSQVSAVQDLLIGAGFEYQGAGNLRTRTWTQGNEGKSLGPGVLAGRFGASLATPLLVSAFDRATDQWAISGSLAEVFRQSAVPGPAQARVAALVDAKRNFYFEERKLLDDRDLDLVAISGAFGPDPSYRLSGGQHTGIDLAGRTAGGADGLSAYALFQGKVVAEKLNTTSSGYSAVIEYGFPFEGTFYSTGVQAQYMHLKGPSPLEVGQLVSPSNQVGQIGTTGASSGPHLHYQLQGNLGGLTSDPLSPAWDMERARRDLFLGRLGSGPSGAFSRIPTDTSHYWASNPDLSNYFYNTNNLLRALDPTP